jgi:hypothetical protein
VKRKRNRKPRPDPSLVLFQQIVAVLVIRAGGKVAIPAAEFDRYEGVQMAMKGSAAGCELEALLPEGAAPGRIIVPGAH